MRTPLKSCLKRHLLNKHKKALAGLFLQPAASSCSPFHQQECSSLCEAKGPGGPLVSQREEDMLAAAERGARKNVEGN